MARPLRLLVVIGALLAVVLLVAVGMRSCRSPQPSAASAASFSAAGVPVESPNLPLEIVEVRGDLHEGYMDWVCLVRCTNPGGCSADVRATVFYRSTGSAQRITLSGPINVPIGARARLGAVQRPPHRVDSVERVSVRVVRTFSAGDPVPTPEY